jgi:crotonobetainyl-CoA:carnitine CoA-transferase CaiB-like acyl-CoA transferase
VQLLAGYRALDLTDLSGQLCGKLLADLGVEVVKLEPPGGDPVRRLGPFKDDLPHLEGSLRFAYLNSGKLSLTLDYAQPAGRELLLRLVEQADVLLESFQPGHLAELGLGPDILRARNPRLIVTSLSGFGQDGPHRDYLASDIVGFAMGGLMYISGDPSMPPLKAPETQAYYFGCLYAAYGTLLSLWQRQRDDQGRGVDVSIQETLASQEHLVRAAGFDGHSLTRGGSQHGHVAPANIFPTSDGYVYLFVTAQHWRKLLALWPDHPPELDGPEWGPNAYRRAHADWLNPQVASFTSRYSRDEFVDLMQRNGLPSLPVNRPRDFVDDEHIQARRLFAAVDHPYLGHYTQVTPPGELDGQRLAPSPPPLLGQHTRQLLTDLLGLSPTDFELLFAEGII